MEKNERGLDCDRLKNVRENELARAALSLLGEQQRKTFAFFYFECVLLYILYISEFSKLFEILAISSLFFF